MRVVWFVVALALLCGIPVLYAQVVINEVLYDPPGNDTNNEWIEIYNQGNSPVDLTGWDLDPSDQSFYTFPSFVLGPKSYVLVHVNATGTDTQTDLYAGKGNMSNTQGVFALFRSTSHTTATIVDYMEYGSGGQANESKAVSAGIWTAGDFVPDVAEGHSLEYDGSGNSSSDWFDQANPTPNNDNSLPVELNYFNARYLEGYVLLKWQTQSEVNNQGFTVWRSLSEEEGYEQISPLIVGAGTSSGRNNYEYKDSRVEPGTTYYYRLQQVDTNGEVEVFGPIQVIAGIPDKEGAAIPRRTRLVANYPNPFNPGTVIFFEVAADETRLAISVFDLLGRKVRNLVDAVLPAGEHQLVWDGSSDNGVDLPGGTYFCRLAADGAGLSVIKMLKLE